MSDRSEPFAGSPNVLHLPNEAASVRAARAFVSATIRRWGMRPVTDAGLPTSEVVSNAIMHTENRISVRVRRLGGRARVEVHDVDPARPEVRPADSSPLGGFGTGLVDQLASSWGVVAIEGDGKIVWFDIDLLMAAGPRR
jgi:anti-sigma regulatory factor (Ser/Thr protein kinase)